VGRTCRPVAPITTVSRLVLVAMVRETVIVAGFVSVRFTAVISRAAVKLILGRELVLNSNPAGALRASVRLVPMPRSALVPSAIVIGPSVVHEPEPPLAAVSAEMEVPPDAPVTVTAAQLEGNAARKSAQIAGRTCHRWW